LRFLGEVEPKEIKKEKEGIPSCRKGKGGFEEGNP